MIVYHGSDVEVTKPLLSKGRTTTDFGKGFYVTENKLMAERWAARQYGKRIPHAIVSVYKIELNRLDGLEFLLDKEWLDFVYQNRNGKHIVNLGRDYDYLMGATADDKMFAVLKGYGEGTLTPEDAVECLNMMKVGTQIALITDRAVDELEFVESYELMDEYRIAIRKEDKKLQRETNNIVNRVLYKHMPEVYNSKTAKPHLRESKSQTSEMNSF